MGSLNRIIMVLLAAAAAAGGQAGSGLAADRLVIERADRNSGYMADGKLVTELQGNVVLHYDSLTIKAQNARLMRDEGIMVLTDRISLSKGEQVLTCDRMTFYKKEKIVVGSGRVDYRDGRNLSRLRGTEGRYDIRSKELTVTGSPTFQRYDTASAETLDIAGRTIVYNDSARIASAKDQVVIRKGKLHCTCARADYLARRSRAALRGMPRIVYDIHTLNGDSVDLLFDTDTLKGISVAGRARGMYREKSGADTSLTDIAGDSMYMRLTASGRVDSIWTIGNVLSTYHPATRSDTANRVTGKAMILAFAAKTGDLENALVWGNARSTYYIQDKQGRGRNESSGDTIFVRFANGKASDLTLAGSVRGTYYPQD